MKYMTVTTEGYRSMTDQMIRSSGVSDWVIKDMGGDTGDFRTESFNGLCRSKPALIYELLQTGESVWSLDGDVIFFEPLDKIRFNEIADIQAQIDPDSGMCCGFCLYHPTDTVMDFFRYFIPFCEQSSPELNEQLIFNWCLREYSKTKQIRLAGFPTVYSYGLYVWERDRKTDIWDGQDFSLPDNTQAFHANYTICMETKKKLLAYVKEKRS